MGAEAERSKTRKRLAALFGLALLVVALVTFFGAPFDATSVPAVTRAQLDDKMAEMQKTMTIIEQQIRLRGDHELKIQKLLESMDTDRLTSRVAARNVAAPRHHEHPPEALFAAEVAKTGCHHAVGETQCIQSVDGRADQFAKSQHITGQNCAWCCGKACVLYGSENKCEPVDWLKEMANVRGVMRYRTGKGPEIEDLCSAENSRSESLADLRGAEREDPAVAEQQSQCSVWCTPKACEWTQQFSCPWAVTDGSSGRSGSDGSIGYKCCCEQNRRHVVGQCGASGAASTLQHMQYWLHGTKASPIQSKHKRKRIDHSWQPATRPGKYILLNHDNGGFNNIRLAFEIGIVFAVLTGRTIVLPDKEKWYLLGDTKVGFEDFFSIPALQKLCPCITMEEYKRLTKDTHSSQTLHDIEGAHALSEMVVYPNKAVFEEAHEGSPELKFHRGKPARTIRDLTPGTMLYDTDVLTINNEKNRLLATWHTMFFFANEAHEMALKRLMRDHVHYNEQILAYAVRGIDELGGWQTYTAIHVRRGDFQYKETALGADKLYNNIAPLLKRSGKTDVYIMTDEASTPFFQPFLNSGHQIHFLKSLKTVGDVPYHLVGMVEQMISAGGNLFVGTRLSTFSSYTMRVRGYIVGAQNKEMFYADRKYTGNEKADSNEKFLDVSNHMFGQGELAVFREPKNVWVEEDWRR